MAAQRVLRSASARRGLIVTASLLALHHPMRAAELPPPPTVEDGRALASAPQALELELVVNGMPSGRIVSVMEQDGVYTLESTDLLAVGIDIAQAGAVRIPGISGINAEYDAPRQRLHLTVSPDTLPSQRLAAAPRRRDRAEHGMGALLNYDLYVSHGGGDGTLASLYHEGRFFSEAGLFLTSGVARTGPEHGYMRYDSLFRRSDEQSSTTVEVGDLITRTLPWGTAVRIGGIQFSRDFAIRPDIVTYPMPRFSGSAALPSSIDLLLDGQRVISGRVAPGPFMIDTLPPISGRGDVNLVVTDMHGRSVSTSLPFYVTNTLLQPGLLDFAVAFGSLRQNYGMRNFDYDGVFSSASARLGVTDKITVEGRAEIADNLQVIGGGAIVGLGNIGAVNASYSRSLTANGPDGAELILGYNYQTKGLAFSLRHSRRSAHFIGIERIGRPGRGSEQTTAATVSKILGGGTLGLGYFDMRREIGPDVRLANASWSVGLWGSMRVYASVSRDFADKTMVGTMSINIPLGPKTGRVSASVIQQADRPIGWRVDHSRAAPVSGGWGWSANAVGGSGADLYMRGDVSLRTQPIQLRAGAYGAKEITGWVGATGSLVFMENGLFTANRVADAFAIVDSGKVGGVPVKYENQYIGRTNKRGKLLIPSVNAYYPAKFEIDPMNLSDAVRVPIVEQKVSVAAGSGYVIHFPVEMTHPIRAVLNDGAGLPITVGSHAWLGSAQAIIGWDGQVYFETDLTDAPAAREILVVMPNGSSCRAPFIEQLQPQPGGETAMSDLGELPCN